MQIDELRELVTYNPDTGHFLWTERFPHMFHGPNPTGAARAWNKRYAGKPAFNALTDGGYLTGVAFATRLAAHRLAWAIHFGEWPSGQLDHINGNRSDNRIANLRLVTPTQNQYNAKAKSRSLYEAARGAQYHKRNKKWCASIRVHLGYFDTPEAAAKAYEDAARLYHSRYYLPKGVRNPDF